MEFGIVLQWSDFRHTGLSPTLVSLINVVPDMQLDVAVLVLPQRNAVVVA